MFGLTMRLTAMMRRKRRVVLLPVGTRLLLAGDGSKLLLDTGPSFLILE